MRISYRQKLNKKRKAMATKKVGKAAMRAARKGAVSVSSKKPAPKKGDVVWVNRYNVLGIFVAYSAREKVVTLCWPAEVSFMNIWPDASKSIFDVEREDIEVLSPTEVFTKVAWLVYGRERKMREELAYFANNKLADRFFSKL